MTSNFVDRNAAPHLPLYRQKQIFERTGRSAARMKNPPSTLTDNINAACKALEPTYNAIRLVALGRKKRNVAPYLFAGTHDTAQNAAMIYSLFATCKKHEVNPHEWLLDVLRKLNDPNYEGKFSNLLPHRWKKHPS